MSSRKGLISILIFFLAIVRLSAQEKSSQTDSLVRLLSAQSMELIDKDGVELRKVTGPARFLHNDTYLICDTALWNVRNNEIYAIKNVKILQEQTVLTGDTLTYYVDQDLARFRGTLVQLEDKDHNVLRTEFLDYNTRDSVATFFNGGAMKDADGQIIESKTGKYDSKAKTFTFTEDVNMFTDSVFIRTTTLVYDANRNTATFGPGTNAWQEDNMLSSNGGWYDRTSETFLFRKDVHGMSDTQEGWADSLYYYKNTRDIELLGHAQVTDTTRDVSALAGRMMYTDTTSRLVMTRKPVIISAMKSDNPNAEPDSIYFGADTLIAESKMMFQIDPGQVKNAEKRLADLSVDAVQTYRQKAAKEAAEAAAKAAANDPNRPQNKPGGQNQPDQAGQNPPGPETGGDTAVDTKSKPGGQEKLKGAEQGQDKPEQSAELNSKQDAQAADEAEGGPESDGISEMADSLSGALANGADSLSAVADSLGIGEEGRAEGLEGLEDAEDSTALRNGQDSLSAGVDSLSMAAGNIPAGLDSLAAGADSLTTGLDSLSTATDSLAGPRDSTKVNFITAIHNVKLYKSDMQIACDSLEYNGLDSLVRMYESPVVWNETNRQYSADSLYAVVRNQSLEKASLMSNAFIIIQEDSLCFDQIRATEMLAYFDTTGALRRFDALGDANAIFYLQEDSVYATVNKSQAKMLYAEFKKGNIDRVYYFDGAKNDGYPVAQMRADERVLKGFTWQPDKRPRGKHDISDLTLRPSERSHYASVPRTSFNYTDRYFPGYMKGVMKKIEEGKVAKSRAEAQRKEQERLTKEDLALADSSAIASGLDSLSVGADTLNVALDSLSAAKDSLNVVTDSLSHSVDSLKQASDSLSGTGGTVAAKDEKALKKEQKAAERAAKIAAREAKWARLDSLDSVKVQIKADKAAAKQRAKKLKQLQALDAQNAKEQARLEKYKEAYLKQKEKEDARKAKAEAKKKNKKAKSAADETMPSDTLGIDIPIEGQIDGQTVEQTVEQQGDNPVKEAPEILPLPLEKKSSEALPVKKESGEAEQEG